MAFHSRLKRLENKLEDEQELHAVFRINYYENKDEGKKVRDRLVDEYFSDGKPKPTLSIFITDFGGTNPEGFVYSYKPSVPRSYARN